MAATLTVSQVRQALFQSHGVPAHVTEGSSVEAGILFHRVVHELLRPDSESNLEAVLRDLDPVLREWQSRLIEQAYDQLLGPLLTQKAATLQGQGNQVLLLWEAVQEVCRWLAELWWEITRQGTVSAANQCDWFQSEQTLVCELQRPGWREPVLILGQADAILRIPSKSNCCVLEFKTGHGSPVLDLCQTALYHLMLCGQTNPRSEAALALVSFHPQRSERLFSATELQGAIEPMIDLIGALAGVTGPESSVALPAIQQPRETTLERGGSEPEASIAVTPPAVRYAAVSAELSPSAVTSAERSEPLATPAPFRQSAPTDSRSSAAASVTPVSAEAVALPAIAAHISTPSAAGSTGQTATSLTNFAPPAPAQSELSPKPRLVPSEIDLSASQAWLLEMQPRLLRTLRQCEVPCRAIQPPVAGPTFGRFYVIPDDQRVATKKVAALAEQLALQLHLADSPAIGQCELGITIDLALPKELRRSVPFSDLRAQLASAEPSTSGDSPLLGGSKIPVGVDLQGTWRWLDLNRSESPTALVIGTPGSGKSQWLRVAIASLLVTNTPQTLQLLLIDPKQNAFTFCEGSPFLSGPIVAPGQDTDIFPSERLEQLCSEMDRRKTLLRDSQSQSLADHVRKTNTPLPRIVCVCDEYADLLGTSGKQERKSIEESFRRLVSVGRATGINVILATQQPRAKVVSPEFRGLLGAKIALRVTSALESQVALEESGAERLLGNGDLYYKCIGNKQRLQGAWLPSSEELSLVSTPRRMEQPAVTRR